MFWILDILQRPGDYLTFLPPNVRHNLGERSALLAHISSSSHQVTDEPECTGRFLPAILRGIRALNDSDEPKIQALIAGDGWTQWDGSDWLCIGCVRAALRERMWIWWLADKIRSGVVLQEDCW